MRTLIKECQPDVVIGMMTSMNVVVSLSCVGLPVKVIVAEHNYPPFSKTSKFWWLARKFSYGLPDRVLALTDEGSKWLLDNTRAAKVASMPNSLVWPLPNLEPNVPLTNILIDGRRYILGAGRLSKQKCFSRLIESFTKMTDKHPQWDLIIAGEGDCRKELEQLIIARGLENRIFLPGRIGNIGSWYEAVDIYALSSNYEGFPGTLLEAMAAGCAVVSVDCKTGPSDIISDGFNGLLVGNSVEDLATGLDTLMENDDLRLSLSANAVKVTDDYSESTIMVRWDQLFLELLENK